MTAAGQRLRRDEIPTWLRDLHTPGWLLFGPVENLERFAVEHGHAMPTLLELTEARKIRRARSARSRARALREYA